MVLVSVDNLDNTSPVLVLSKKPISSLDIALNNNLRNRTFKRAIAIENMHDLKPPINPLLN